MENAKNLKMEFKNLLRYLHIYSLRFNHKQAHRDIKDAL